MSDSRANGSKGYLYAICGVAVIGGLLFGYDTAVISGAEQALQKYFENGLNSPDNEYYGGLLHGIVTSSALIGCVIGGFISGVMAQNLGRRNTLIVSSVLFFLSALGSYLPEFLMTSSFLSFMAKPTKAVMFAFIFYRILGGVGVGVASAICPMYIAEVAPANIRGVLVSWNQFAIIFGQLVVYAINTVIRGALGNSEEVIQEKMVEYGWRRMFVSEAVPAALFGILLIFVPKTPRFLVMKGNEEEATKVLTRINGEGKAKSILQEIKDTINSERKESLLSYGVLCILVGALLSFFQQAIGINVALYYAPRIFEKMGSSSNAAMIQTVVMGIVNILFTLVAIFTVEKWGRKPLLMIGSIGMTIGMGALAILSYVKIVSMLTLVFIIIYTASFMMSWGPICWVLISEIFPNTIRANAVAIAVATQWISNLVVSTTFIPLQKWSIGTAYLIYCFFSILSAFFVWFLVPETKGKTLEDMTELWRSKMGKKTDLPY